MLYKCGIGLLNKNIIINKTQVCYNNNIYKIYGQNLEKIINGCLLIIYKFGKNN